jgi:hypothetical protein
MKTSFSIQKAKFPPTRLKLCIISLLLSMMVSCGYVNYNKKLKLALEQAGINRKELEKVINHYSKKPEDSLKLEAACFLIENMPGHFYYINNSSVQYNALLDEAALCKHEDIEVRKNMIKTAWDSIQRVHGYFNFYALPLEKDVQTITADYLISHIDSSIVAWKTPWAKHLSFDDFCRYLLPYRVENEPLENWMNEILCNIPWLADLKYSGISAFEACCLINDSLKNWVAVTSTFDYLPRQPVSDLFFSQTGNCVDISTLTTLVMRTAGLPVASIRCPGGHTWNVLLDQDGILKDFMGTEFNPVTGFGGMYYHRLKVDMMKAYLKTYYKNEEILNLYTETVPKNIPPFFRNPYLEDISSDVLYRRDLNIPIVNGGNNYKNYPRLYLHQLLPKWREGVTISYLNNTGENSVCFETSKRGTYFVSSYNNGSYRYHSHCVTILNNDSLHVWQPNWEKRQYCKIFRKASMSPKMRGFSEKLYGAVIQGSNNRDFSDAHNLGKIGRVVDFLDGDSIKTPNNGFRYYRLLPVDTNSIHIAELQFIENGKINYGKPIGIRNEINIEYAFDDDIRTNFNGASREWIGIDLGKPIKIDSYKVLPRNNFNIIEPGDTYELFVLDTAHISLGVKIATSNYIEYDNIPEGAILYLLNRSRGKEFGHFFIADGRQEWNLMNCIDFIAGW